MKSADFVSIREYVERILAERESRYMQMFKSSDEAVNKADAALKEYKLLANEFRGTLKDQAATFMPRAEAETRFSQHAEKIRALELAERAGEGGTKAKAEGKTNSQWLIGVLVGVGVSAIGFYLTKK